MGEAAENAKRGLPPDAVDVTAEHPTDIGGHKVDSTWQQPCGCRLIIYDEDELVPQHEPCVPHALNQAGLALIAASSRIQKDIRAEQAAQERPVIHTPSMRDYGRGPNNARGGK